MNLLIHIFIILCLIYGSVLLVFFIGLFFPNLKRSDEQPFVSVMIAARNEDKALPHLLEDLVKQTYPADKFEIIVADDHSEDGTAACVREMQPQLPNLKLVQIDSIEPGLTAKKNALTQAIRVAKGEIILSADADCRVWPTWIEEMVRCFTPETGMVIGFSQLKRRGDAYNFIEKFQALDFLSLMAAAQGTANLGLPLAASGQNMAYRRAAYDEVGGFSQIGHRVSGDDVLFLQLVRSRTNWKVRFAASEQAFNTSQPESTLGAFLNQRKRWASNGAYQIKMNPVFFAYVAVTFLVNLSLFIGIPFAILNPQSFSFIWIGLSIKLITEGLIALKGSRIYQRPDLLPIFPLWFLLQMPYVIAVGIAGSLGSFSWKDRKHRAEKAP
jgi:cellulose synthase/poly-beta-1,6-N-acetylglucosamine synthase-like glycosyltransferase